ncbi:MAG: tetratricopeptide repeat protein, partial [Planctomycetota bacterium]
ALLGLDEGVAAGTVLAAPFVNRLAVVEPLAGVWAAHRDPGDLYGYINGRPLDDPRLVSSRLPFAAWLRARRNPCDLLLAGRAAPRAPLSDLAAADPLVVWRVPRLRREHLACLPEAPWAYVAGDDALLLLCGFPPPDLSALRARAGELPQLAAALRRLGLEDPLAVLSTLAAPPAALSAAAIGEGGLSPAEVQRAGAKALPAALGWTSAAGADALAALAERMALRGAPAALPLARRAVAEARTARTLRALGDVLRAIRKADEALHAWREALALDPASVATRLSLAVYHESRREWRKGLAVLGPALGVDPVRDPQVHYRLGKLSLGAKDYRSARKHLSAAGSFADAPQLLELARQLSRDEPAAARLSPSQRLEAAGRLVARRAWDAAAEALLPLAHAPQELDPDQRLRLADLLAEVAPSRTPAARRLLHRLEAEVLAGHPSPEEPRVALRRVAALIGAGDPAAAESLAASLLDRPDAEVDAWRALGDARRARGAWRGAIEAYERYLQQSPASSVHTRVYLAIADAARRLGDRARALRALEDAERLFPGHPRVRLNLGTLLWEEGRRAAARKAYRAYLQVAPPGDPARERVERLLGER